MMVVVKGELELIIEQNNKEYLLDTLGTGSVLGIYSIINETQY